LSLGSMEEYVQSSEDSRVAMVVTKYLAAKSDEQMAKEMAAGNVTTTLAMLNSQSSLMKELESKLVGVKAVSWETMTEQQRQEAEIQRQENERELARLRMEIEENESLVTIAQLIDLMQGLGQQDRAYVLIESSRKQQVQRRMRNEQWNARGDMDDWAASNMLEQALSLADGLISEFPYLQEELTNIREKINEQLAHFSK
jgi:hypothetical protein